MTEYRIYKIKQDGHLFGPAKVVDCHNDQDAVNEAKQVRDGHSIEIWQGSRVVLRIDPAGEAPFPYVSRSRDPEAHIRGIPKKIGSFAQKLKRPEHK